MRTQKTPSTAATVNQTFDLYERQCLDEILPSRGKDSRRFLLHLRAQFGSHEGMHVELRTHANRLDLRNIETGRMRQVATLLAVLSLSLRLLSIEACFLRKVYRE